MNAGTRKTRACTSELLDEELKAAIRAHAPGRLCHAKVERA